MKHIDPIDQHRKHAGVGPVSLFREDEVLQYIDCMICGETLQRIGTRYDTRQGRHVPVWTHHYTDGQEENHLPKPVKGKPRHTVHPHQTVSTYVEGKTSTYIDCKICGKPLRRIGTHYNMKYKREAPTWEHVDEQQDHEPKPKPGGPRHTLIPDRKYYSKPSDMRELAQQARKELNADPYVVEYKK